jgi:hypothetical protein
MCIVLGLNFKKKLMEMGVTREEDIEESRVLSQIDYLQGTIDVNYEKVMVTSLFFLNVSKHYVFLCFQKDSSRLE